MKVVKNSIKKIKKTLKNFWFLLWKDESFKGWLFSIIFIFLFIRFIFFPGLSLITGTSLPLAIVESCSMYHEGNFFSDFDEWWDRQENKYSQFEIIKNDFNSFKNGLNKGDILFITGVSSDQIEIGDVIIFEGGDRHPVIHRVVEIREQNGEYFFSTLGDNNADQLPFERNISEDRIVGMPRFRIAPYLGWVKLIFFEGQRTPSERGFCSER